VETWLSYRDGDQSAFTKLYRMHAPTVAKYAWSIVHDASVAEEVLQESFLIAWDKRRASRLTDDSVLPWLLVIARNVSRNQLRKLRVHNRGRQIGDQQLEAEPAMDVALHLTWIEAELATLSDTDAQLCRLCLIEGYTYAEAAQILDTSEGAIGKRLQRARAQLRSSLGSSEN
jgi:RNA polymerase sigma factor (sigma-70 family)